MSQPSATIVIVTRNRRNIAANAAASALAQDCDAEVLLIDDGSTDATADFIRDQFPAVRVERFDQQGGYIVRRNQAFKMARGSIVFSIDDDAVLTEPSIVRTILQQFHDPRVGAIAIPFVNSVDEKDVKDFKDPPDDGQEWVKNTFIGTAFALRRDIFVQLGGFQEKFFHWGEESEYSQRLFAAGYIVLAGRSAVIRHFPRGGGKYRREVNRYIYRNYLLGTFFNAPLRYALPVIAVGTVRPLLQSLKQRHTFTATVEGLAMGWRDIVKLRRLRQPLNLKAYKGWLAVRRRRFVPLTEVASLLPPMR